MKSPEGLDGDTCPAALPHNQYPDSQLKKHVRKVGYQANSLEFGSKTNITHF